MVRMVYSLVSFLMRAEEGFVPMLLRQIAPFLIAMCFAATVADANIGGAPGLLHAARAAGEATSAEIFGRTSLSDVGKDDATSDEGTGAEAGEGAHSTRVVIITAAVTAVATAALTYLLLRDEPCIEMPRMEYYVPRGSGIAVPLGINPPTRRGCVFGWPELE